MANKTLTIDVNPNAVPNGTKDAWTPLDNAQVFISNIHTPQLSAKTNVGELVSGIPSAFARVDLFSTALNHVANQSAADAAANSNGQRNLLTYYYQLVQEWRGLIACMALDYAYVSVRKIDLRYSDNQPINTTRNVYEPKGAFGNMLMRRTGLWSIGSPSGPDVPYINIIKYHGKVVGATAPETLLFTSSGYNATDKSTHPWVDSNGKFKDPQEELKPQEVATLHAYIAYILKGLDQVEGSHDELDYSSVRRELEKWRDELAERARVDGYELSIGSTPPVSADFTGPFKQLFYHEDQLFGVEGTVSESQIEGSVKFDPKELLLPEDAQIARLGLTVPEKDLGKLPILALVADVKGTNDKQYFALPLSPQGLNVYGKNVAALVGRSVDGSAISSTLKAIYDPAQNRDNLEVILTIRTTDGSERTFRKIYTSNLNISGKDFLIWPNFISKQWNQYYLYNELPHNGRSQNYRAIPFTGVMEGNYFRIAVDPNGNPQMLNSSSLVVKCDDEVADNQYKCTTPHFLDRL